LTCIKAAMLPTRHAAATLLKGTPHMNRNVGGIDRLIRFVVGLALVGLALMGTIGWWGFIGLVPIVTAAVGYCPVYPLIGMNTCPISRSPT